MTRITEIEGIGELYAAKLADASVSTQEQLLEACCEPAGRKRVAEQSGIASKLILRWTNRADLTRVKGIGSEYADLLECAGVDTVPELAQRNATNLHAQMVEVNAEKLLVRTIPSYSQVADWINLASELPRKICY